MKSMMEEFLVEDSMISQMTRLIPKVNNYFGIDSNAIVRIAYLRAFQPS
jgi:hypothetical protein